MARERLPFYERVKLSLEQALAHANGDLQLRTTTLQRPIQPPKLDAETLTALRESTNLSPTLFAEIFGTTSKTVEAWEAGSRKPTKPQRRLLQLLVAEPAAMCKAVGIAPIAIEGFAIIVDENGKRRIIHEQPVEASV